MNKNLPDKWIRKYVSEQINNIVVDGVTVPCFDYRVSGSDFPRNYVIMSTQSNNVVRNNKCSHKWESTILLEIVSMYNGTGNPGSRLLADNILDAVRGLLTDIQLDPLSDLIVIDQEETFPNDLATVTVNENVFRKFIRIELLIN